MSVDVMTFSTHLKRHHSHQWENQKWSVSEVPRYISYNYDCVTVIRASMICTNDYAQCECASVQLFINFK